MISLKLNNLREYSYFIQAIVQKDFKVRYAQSFLGLFWVILEPLLLVITLALVFTFVRVRVAPDEHSFIVFFYSAVLPWTVFRTALTQGTRTFIQDKKLMGKLSYPRYISVISSVCVYISDFFFASIAFFMIYFSLGYTINVYYMYIPLLLLLLVMLCCGVILFLASLNVYVRDVGKVAVMTASFMFWFTPIIFQFPFSGITKYVYYVNPMAGIVTSFRNILMYGQPPVMAELYGSMVITTLFLILGIYTYKKLVRGFLDVI